MSSPIPINEQARLEALKQYDILDTDAEEAFDNCTKLASQICGTPISLISLIDESRQWFKSRVGLEVSETDRDLAFCAHAIVKPDELFVVEDATKDPRFVKNDLVTSDPKIRFYAGAPLVSTEGYGLGTLCVVDRQPRQLKPEQLEALRQLSGVAQQLMELRRVSFELVQVKQELQTANVELARTARLKDEFLANMSHELRTPLNAVLGMSEALQEQVLGTLNPDQIDLLGDIESSGRHLLSLINDILDLSKIEAGKLELQIGEVGVESVSQASLRLVKQVAHTKRLKILSSFDSSLSIIMADERHLKQILVNLLSNAVKFTPEGGTMGLEVVGDEDEEVVQFIVWDTGVGMAVEDMQDLFQPFTQLDRGFDRQHEGTGLGLALVYRLVEMHGGSISVESEVGQGSRFVVSLPWSNIEQSTNDVLSPGDNPAYPDLEDDDISYPSVDSFKPLILLAEDNEANIKTFTRYLQSKGYRVIVARNGAEAVKQAKEQQPHLILMDVQMPGMDGLEATQQLRSETAFSRVPIIALTALAMPGDRERCLAAGVDDYISKPVYLKGLVQTIEKHLQNKTKENVSVN